MGQAQCCTADDMLMGTTNQQTNVVACMTNEEMYEQGVHNCGYDKPSFEILRNLFTEDEVHRIADPVALGVDASSKHFATREKAIRFITVSNGRVRLFSQNYFAQNADYNDFSGGYRRHFALIEDEQFENSAPLAKVLLKFVDYYSIPEKTVILVQIQTSYFDDPSYRSSRASVVGQGIHTDGHDRAGILCLHRGKLISGAENQFHGELDGSEPLCDPVTLEAGDCAMFKDNEIYHYVTRASVSHEWSDYKDIQRTVAIFHAEAETVMDGIQNPHNNLGTNESAVKIRNDIETFGVARSSTRRRSVVVEDFGHQN